MSKRNRDYVEEYLYGPFRGNPPRDRKSLYETMYMRVLTEFATNRFKWEGLPPEIDKRFLEYELFRHALCVFFYDDRDYDRYFALRGSGAGMWNMYDNPTVFSVIGNTMVNRRLKAGSECIPIWGNTMRVPDWDLVLLWSSKLADIERTIEINLQAMRKPWIIAVDDNERLTMQNVWRQAQEGEPVIFGTDTMTAANLRDKISLLDLKIDKDLVLNLQIAKAKMWNEVMTFLGIDNANQDKRERLVAQEVAANNSQVSAARASALGAREYAAEQINKKYKLDISVTWNDDNDTIAESGDGSTMSVSQIANNSSLEN